MGYGSEVWCSFKQVYPGKREDFVPDTSENGFFMWVIAFITLLILQN
jgi:hypothetical protein